MGCPNSYEFRRQELRSLGVISPEDSDIRQAQKIVDSYLGNIPHSLVRLQLPLDALHCILYFFTFSLHSLYSLHVYTAL